MYEEMKNTLKAAGIPFTYPSAGCFKITTNKLTTLMFYPKSNKLIWVKNKKDFQHKYSNPEVSEVFNKIKSLI